MNISVVGIGKLGAPLAAVLASKGNHVTGVDVIGQNVQLLNDGQAPVPEPGLAELISKSRDRLSATSSYSEAIGKTDITFIVVPTPSDNEGNFSLRFVIEAVGHIGNELRQKNSYHLVVVTSTIMPGDSDTYIVPALEKAIGMPCGTTFGYCYSPEFIALGTVIRDMTNPDFVLIGETDRYSGDILEGIYRNACENNPRVARMNFVNAELTKLAVNTYVTTKISYANMLAGLCERLPGANVDVVTSAVGFDSRIGLKYLKAATAYGGPCFPRDNLALGYLGRRLGKPAILAEATHETNRRHTDDLLELILSKRAGGRVGILGLSYKPNTTVVEESTGMALAAGLIKRGVEVVVYDPIAMESARRVLNSDVTFANSVEDCLEQVQVVVVTTPLPEFCNIPALAKGRRLAIVDCWRILDEGELQTNIDYVPVGVGELRAMAQQK
jgi:UDPglucose 6-dehydrogenase